MMNPDKKFLTLGIDLTRRDHDGSGPMALDAREVMK